MEWAALVTWVLTAGGGFLLLGLWLKHGGMQQAGQPGSRIRAGRILGHFALAATGLVLWIVYVASDSDTLAWIAFVLLLVVALLGFSMLATWLAQRRRPAAPVASSADNTGAGTATATATASATAPAEQRFPVAVVALHGVLAATTLVLVLLTAAGVGGS
jgi:uncharacterized membrane protein YeiB